MMGMMDDRAMKGLLDLRLFDGEGGGAAGGGAAGGAGGEGAGAQEGGKPEAAASKRAQRNPLANVQYGRQEAPDSEDGQQAEEDGAEAEGTPAQATEEARREAFEQMIRGEYKGLFDDRVQSIINERFKGQKAMQTRMEAVSPILDMLAEKYGVQADDPQKLMAAIEEDSGFYEEEALRKGLTVEQLREFKRMARENEQLRQAEQARAEQENSERIYARWMQEGEETKRFYPGFDMQGEAQNPLFMQLLQSGVPVKAAYEVIHKDEIIGGAMQYTAQQVTRKVTNDVRARGQRPVENGAGGHGAADVRADVRKLTKEDRAEIARRAMRGERISFG